MTVVSDTIDERGRRVLRVEPATHEAPRLAGWKCWWVAYVGGSHTTFTYKKAVV